MVEQQLIQRRARLSGKMPEIQKTLDALLMLQQRHRDEQEVPACCTSRALVAGLRPAMSELLLSQQMMMSLIDSADDMRQDRPV